jgi:MoaE-MoaD fusion protein
MITIKLFAILKDKAGIGEFQIPGRTEPVEILLRQVSQEYPVLSDILSTCAIMVSVNREFVKNNALVKDGDEVALMPPFSGGDQPSGSVRIQQEPFSIEREVNALRRSSTSIGAIVTFLGTTRDISRGKEVAKLEFEHYPGMAEKKLGEVRARAIKDFGLIDVTIVHRVGTMPAGEEIVLIAVAAGHRDEAFRACRYCIDELKRIAPIWKKETTPEGEVWVEEHP